MRYGMRVIGVFLLALWMGTGAVAAGELTIIARNMRSGDGDLHIAVCSKELFLEDDCLYKAIVPAQKGETTAVISGIPAGTYAVQTYFDENRNDKLDRTFIGVPKEGIGFSRDPSYMFSPPSFKDSSFQFNGIADAVTFSMRYY